MPRTLETQRPAEEWKNWSGSLRFKPAATVKPQNEGEVADLIHQAREKRLCLRPVGSGHSSTPILETGDVLVSMEKLAGLTGYDTEACEAAFGPGTVLLEMNKALKRIGLAPHNLGDVALQTIGGAIGTGTHGTGYRLRNLSTMLIGGRLVTGTGEVIAFSAGRDRELLRALRVSLGALGIFTEVRLKLLPAYDLRRRELFCTTGQCLANLEYLILENRNFDFYWYPRSDGVKLRILNEPDRDTGNIPWARPDEDNTAYAADILHKHSDLENRFDEMEYQLPAEAGPACFQEIRRRMRERWCREVAWRVLYRTVAPDDAFLSPAHDRQTVSISLHHNAGLPFEAFFADIEPVFRAHGGRPHWAKKHNLKAGDLKPLYPEWDRFHAVRQKLDPDGIFLSSYLRTLFGMEEHP